MAQAVRDLPDEVQGLIEVDIRDLGTRAGRQRIAELKARSLPAMALDGCLRFESIIPGQDELIGSINELYLEVVPK